MPARASEIKRGESLTNINSKPVKTLLHLVQRSLSPALHPHGPLRDRAYITAAEKSISQLHQQDQPVKHLQVLSLLYFPVTQESTTYYRQSKS